MTKTCTECGSEKLLDKFHKDSQGYLGMKLLLLWLALITNPYSAEMDVIVVYPYAWSDVSYVQDRPSWVVYSDWRPPGEYDCIIARSYKNEGDAWKQARKNLKTNRCRKGVYGE